MQRTLPSYLAMDHCVLGGGIVKALAWFLWFRFRNPRSPFHSDLYWLQCGLYFSFLHFFRICCTFPLAFASTYAVFRRHVSRRLVAPEAHRFLPPGLFCVLAGFCGNKAFIVFCRLQVSSNLSIRRNVARKSCYVSFIFAFENDMYNVRVACKH